MTLSMTPASIAQRRFKERHPERYKEQRQRSTKKQNDRRRALLNEIKLTRGCIDCGYDLAPEALCFDHRDPMTKIFAIGHDKSQAWDKVLIEIAKCDIRCANCHAIRTKREGHFRPKRSQL